MRLKSYSRRIIFGLIFFLQFFYSYSQTSVNQDFVNLEDPIEQKWIPAEFRLKKTSTKLASRKHDLKQYPISEFLDTIMGLKNTCDKINNNYLHRKIEGYNILNCDIEYRLYDRIEFVLFEEKGLYYIRITSAKYHKYNTLDKKSYLNRKNKNKFNCLREWTNNIDLMIYDFLGS